MKKEAKFTFAKANILYFSGIDASKVISANAQLGLPTTKVKDTMGLSKVCYNETELNRADWPDTISGGLR